jgi:hypothetical protein
MKLSRPVSLFAFGLALPALACAEVSPPPSAAWTDCGIAYSQHLSSKSDAGGDVKDDSLACSRSSGNGRIQTFELGMLADTPPNGSRKPVFLNGQPQLISGRPSDQRDTFEAYAGFGEEFDYRTDALALFNIRAGEINGLAVDGVRGFIDATHRWEGKGYSRHSPLSSEGRPLLQVTALHASTLLGTSSDEQGVSLTHVESITAGTSLDALTVGLMASLHGSLRALPLPTGIPGLALRAPQGNALYAGVFAQPTAYGIATEDAGTAPRYAYAQVGATVTLGKHLAAQLAFTHPLANRVQQQVRDGYNYVSATGVYRF